MRIVILIFAVVIGFCSASMTTKILEKFENQPPKELFKVWHFVHRKSYNLNSEEAIKRYRIFKDNMKVIKEHNSKESSFKMGYGPFADMTFEEFKNMYAMDWNAYRKSRIEVAKSGKSPNRRKFLFNKAANNNDNTDFSYLYESGVRDQGQCGSCWAFAEAGTIEGRLAQKDQCFRQLSPQQLVSCDTQQGGCNGGHPSRSGPYAKDVGLVDDSVYQYSSGDDGSSQACKQDIIDSATKYKISDSRYCEPQASSDYWRCDDGEWESELSTGPTYVGIEINSALQNYESGVFDAPCVYGPNHAVIAVQLNLTENYVKIRNSWSQYWGEGGYVRVKRDANNNQSCWTELSLWVPRF